MLAIIFVLSGSLDTYAKMKMKDITVYPGQIIEVKGKCKPAQTKHFKVYNQPKTKNFLVQGKRPGTGVLKTPTQDFNISCVNIPGVSLTKCIKLDRLGVTIYKLTNGSGCNIDIPYECITDSQNVVSGDKRPIATDDTDILIPSVTNYVAKRGKEPYLIITKKGFACVVFPEEGYHYISYLVGDYGVVQERFHTDKKWQTPFYGPCAHWDLYTTMNARLDYE